MVNPVSVLDRNNASGECVQARGALGDTHEAASAASVTLGV
jgi:hypothetical protein